MKKTLILTTIIVLSFAGYLLITNNSNSTSEPEETEIKTSTTGKQVAFQKENEKFTVTYSADTDTLFLHYQDATHELERVRSASGAKYASTDGQIVFWEHQGEATIEIDGVSVVEGAKILH